jgi:hypothetical protein
MSALIAGVCISAIGAATGIISAVNGNKLQKKAILQQGQLGYADLAQKKELEKALIKTNSADKRIEILANGVATIRSAQTTSILNATIISRAASKDADKKNTLIAVIGGGVVLLGAVFVLKKTS